MKRFPFAAAVLLAVALSATSAQAATVVTFDELKHDGVVKLHRTNPIVSGGLTFRTDDLAQGFASWGPLHPGNIDPTGAGLMNWTGGATITVSKTGGGLFEFGSIDMADIYNTGGAEQEIEFSFFDGATTKTEVVVLDRLKGAQTFTFNRTVEWFSFKVAGNSTAQFDNVTWGPPVAAAVPEPATWAMMIVGFAGVGGVLRRNRRAAQAAFA